MNTKIASIPPISTFYFILLFSFNSMAYAQRISNAVSVSDSSLLDKTDLGKHFPKYDAYDPAVPVYRIADGKIIHRFFDTSPVSPSGRYVALFRMPYENKEPQAGDEGSVVIVDLLNGKERTVASSKGWETQLGANVQWGNTDNDLYYNEVDSKEWKAFAVKLNIFSGKKTRLNGTVFMVSPDGRNLASYNLISSRRAQGGYGVVLPDSLTPKNIGVPENDGVYITNTRTGKTTMIVSIADIYEKAIPSIRITNASDYEYYCFQVKWNPQGTKLLTTVQWSPAGGGERRRAVITFNADGSDIRTAITPEQWARGGHHVNWCPDGQYISMNLNVDNDPGIELIKARYDGTDLHTVFKTGSGHPSINPHHPHIIITDAYYNEKVSYGDGSVPLRFIDLNKQTDSNIVRMPVVKAMSIYRVDLHPAWDRSSKFVVFNGFAGGTRNVFIADLRKWTAP